MSWIVVGGAALVEAAAARVADGVLSGGAKVFQEQGRRWLSRLFNRTHAERYLTRSAENLLGFYSRELPLSVRIADTVYQSPVTVVVQPAGVASVTLEPIRFRLQTSAFRPPERVGVYTEPIMRNLERGRDKRLTNGSVVSLRKLERAESGIWSAKLAEGRYFDSLATNFAMDHKPPESAESLRESLSKASGALGSFKESPLVNAIGVICLLESADGYLVVQKRSSSVANRPNSLSASVTGGLDFHDLTRGRGPLSLTEIARGALREAHYELGTRPDEMHFLGMVREYLRGGKPEFYFFARSEKSLASIRAARAIAQERHETEGLLGLEFRSDRIADEDSWFAFLDRARPALAIKNSNLTLVTGILLAIREFDRRWREGATLR